MTGSNNSEVSGTVLAIERCSMHDGPGIRTTVFLKGCPLHCWWCHNPESQSPRTELCFLEDKCVLCGACVAACLNGCHEICDGKHVINRSDCQGCGACVNSCLNTALEKKGEVMTVSEVMTEGLRDQEYYADSGGGLTISGGEPMLQYEFTRELLAAAKGEGIHTCIETSGFAPTERFLELLDLVDIFLIDVKESDATKHKEYTGVDLALIRGNTLALDQAGADIILRCPIIPGLNDCGGHFTGIAELANSMTQVREINIMAYHPMGVVKNQRIGKESRFDRKEFTENEMVDSWISAISSQTTVAVCKG